jgi:hypothetical protein
MTYRLRFRDLSKIPRPGIPSRQQVFIGEGTSISRILLVSGAGNFEVPVMTNFPGDAHGSSYAKFATSHLVIYSSGFIVKRGNYCEADSR